MKTAILRTGQSPEPLRAAHGDYDAMSKNILPGQHAEFTTYDVMTGEFPNAPHGYDLFIITGSPCGVYDDLPWIAPLEDFIRAAYAQNVKMVGLCFGHQIMAQALGGRAEKSSKGYGIGVMDYGITVGDSAGRDVSLLAWHQDQVTAAPADATVILTSGFCPFAGFQYGISAMSFQPHPEFLTPFVADLISFRENQTITPEQANAARRSLTKPIHADVIYDLIADFIAC